MDLATTSGFETLQDESDESALDGVTMRPSQGSAAERSSAALRRERGFALGLRGGDIMGGVAGIGLDAGLARKGDVRWLLQAATGGAT